MSSQNRQIIQRYGEKSGLANVKGHGARSRLETDYGPALMETGSKSRAFDSGGAPGGNTSSDCLGSRFATIRVAGTFTRHGRRDRQDRRRRPI